MTSQICKNCGHHKSHHILNGEFSCNWISKRNNTMMRFHLRCECKKFIPETPAEPDFIQKYDSKRNLLKKSQNQTAPQGLNTPEIDVEGKPMIPPAPNDIVQSALVTRETSIFDTKGIWCEECKDIPCSLCYAQIYRTQRLKAEVEKILDETLLELANKIHPSNQNYDWYKIIRDELKKRLFSNG